MDREKKFTKGPWRIESKRTIYHIKGYPSLSAMVHKNQMASKSNANLIAAAPELLEELESHCAACKQRNKDFGDSCPACYTQRAIKKAYGETK